MRVFESRALMRKLEHKRDKVTGSWRKLLNEELNNFYCSPSIIRMIKSRRMRWHDIGIVWKNTLVVTVQVNYLAYADMNTPKCSFLRHH
jgi:hypothetical protein